VHDVGNGQFEATFSATSTGCTDFGYCGWFPAAWQVAATSACSSGGQNIVYVGHNQDSTGTQTATDRFYKSFEPVKLCLYIYRDGAYRPVAETVYATPSRPPPPLPPPPPPPPLPAGPTLLAPGPDARITAGKSVLFRVRSPEPLDLVIVEVSHSAAIDGDGTLANSEVVESDLADDDGGGEHSLRLRGEWTTRPGVYFWQAHRIACNAGATDCDAESEIRRLEMVAPPFAFDVSARARQQLKSPRRSQFNNLVMRLSCNRTCRVRLRSTAFLHRGGRRQLLHGLHLGGSFRLQGGKGSWYGFRFSRRERARMTAAMGRYGALVWRIELRATSVDGESRRSTHFIRMTPPPPQAPTPRQPPVPPRDGPERASGCQGYTPCIAAGPDVDCQGGGGNGPRYVDGPVRVGGSDPYGLDSDGDGLGCET
jgi:hypothetical protein